MKIKVFSQANLLRTLPESRRTLLIRVSSWELEPLPFADRYMDILSMNFLDVTDDEFNKWSDEDLEFAKHQFANPKPISLEQALSIVRFLELYIDKADLLYVHCDAGMSRSPAIAYAISRYMLRDIEQADRFRELYIPNWTVVDRIKEALLISGYELY